jgi:glycosyltransferase involved in cell wall biosynthesis
MSERVPKVSLGVPVYNGERYLPTAIESLLAQDYTDFELLISDNASTDNTYEICQRYAAQDSRVRVYRTPQNIGACPNFNRLVDLARAPYFKWAADDDWCAPQFLSRCIEVLDADPSVVLAYPRTIIVEADGSIVGPYHDRVDASSPDPVERYRNLFANLSLANLLFGVMRTDSLRRTQLQPSYWSGDRALTMELVMLGRFYEIPEPLFYRRYTVTRKKHPLGWTNPSNRRTLFPGRLNLYYHYFKSIQESDLSLGSKLAISRSVVGRLLFPRRLRQVLQSRASAVRRSSSSSREEREDTA